MKNVNIIFKKAVSLFVIFSPLLFISSCKDKPLGNVSSISVSQGTYIGVVHLTWDPVPDASYYNIQRQGTDGQWLDAGTVTESPFDDNGNGLTDNRMQEGVKYNYRIAAGSSDLEDSEYANASGEGWIYEIKPITLTATREDNSSVTLNWSDDNQNLITPNGNLHSFYYIIKRRYENETEFTDIFTTGHMTSVQDMSYTDNTVANDKKAYYKIVGWYDYGYKNMDYGDYEELWTNEFAEVEESGGSIQVNYTVTDLNTLPEADDGYGYVNLKSINSVIYLATIPHPAFGAPVIYKLNNDSWQNISTSYPDGLQGNFDKISICGDGTTLWAGGISDSAYIYSYDGTWSKNLASKNLGLTDVPQNVLVEYSGNTLYALVDHDNKLEIYTHVQGSEWNTAGVIDDNVSVLEPGLREFNNTLYVYYLTINSSQNSTLNIKHLEGSSWQTDFSVAYDYITDIHVNIDGSGNIYFTSQSMEPDIWKGNVFKVTSASSAQEMVSSSDNWIIFPMGIAFDNTGDPVVMYPEIISETAPLELHLAVYDNSQWKELSNNFTDHILPGAIETDNGLYFVYGDGTITNNNSPITLKAEYLTR